MGHGILMTSTLVEKRMEKGVESCARRISGVATYFLLELSEIKFYSEKTKM